MFWYPPSFWVYLKISLHYKQNDLGLTVGQTDQVEHKSHGTQNYLESFSLVYQISQECGEMLKMAQDILGMSKISWESLEMSIMS